MQLRIKELDEEQSTPKRDNIDWTATMSQRFEYYEVDPYSWNDKKILDNIVSCRIKRESTSDTKGSASLEVIDTLGEKYIRVYLIINQNDQTRKECIGTFLAQSPSSTFDGRVTKVTMEAYTPLIELKEKYTPIGYSLLKDENIMDNVFRITRDNIRAPVISSYSEKELLDHFVSTPGETWLEFGASLASLAKYDYSLEPNGTIIFEPVQELEKMQPVWTYTDDNSSILLPELDLDHDIYGIPNVVEIIQNSSQGLYECKIVNDDPKSPTSTVNRGREIVHRVTDENLVPGIPSPTQIKEYAEDLLKKLSSVDYTVSYSHAYCPVRVGDCIRLNYEKAGLKNVKAKVISQSINCTTGCTVDETAVFTEKLWK